VPAKVSEFGTVEFEISGYVLSQDNGERRAMNTVSLIGNLATDVDLKQLSAEKRVASFVLAVDRHSKDGGADFVRIAAWDKQSELCERYLSKGKRVAVDGRLRSRSWEDADGKRRTAIEVVANRVQFLSPPDGREAPAAEVPFEEAAVS